MSVQGSLFSSSGGATFSEDGRYRYRLFRRWAPGPALLWVMLNPSTADADTNDPTVERCERRAREWGYPAVEVVNLFAWRATDPRDLRLQDDPVGPTNDAAILAAADSAGLILCAWGTHGGLRGRSAQVRQLLSAEPLYVLSLTRSGEPGHPLYLPYDLKPKEWRQA